MSKGLGPSLLYLRLVEARARLVTSVVKSLSFQSVAARRSRMTVRALAWPDTMLIRQAQLRPEEQRKAGGGGGFRAEGQKQAAGGVGSGLAEGWGAEGRQAGGVGGWLRHEGQTVCGSAPGQGCWPGALR